MRASRSSCSTAAAWPARSDACAWRSSGCATRATHTRSGAEALADDLGVALQLTNILRDVREDAANGRVYLPAEDLRRFGLLAGGEEAQAAARLAAAAAQAGDGAGRDGAEQLDKLAALVGFEAQRARVVRARHGARTAARPAQRRVPCSRWRASTGACWSASRPTRERGGAARACRCRAARRRGWRRAGCSGPARERGRAGDRARRRPGRHHRGARLRRGGRAGDAAGGAPPARRSRLLVRPRGPGDGQRPARLPALLRGLPRAARAARQRAPRHGAAAPGDPRAEARLRALHAAPQLAAGPAAPRRRARALPAPSAARRASARRARRSR